MKNTHYHKAGFLVTLLSTFGMRALAEDDGSREQLALALGMSKEVLNTFAKPLLGMAGDSILKLSEDARSAIDHELNSHLEGAIKTAYKDALYDIEQEIVKELDLKEDRSQLWRRLLLNEASEKRETYEQMMLDFFIPLRAALSDETSIKDMLDTHQQLQPETYILHIIGTNLPAYAGTDRELFVADIAARFRKHYPHHFLQQLKKDNKAKTVYFTITLDALLRAGIEQKAMLQMVLAELQGEIPAGLAAIKALIAERTTAIEAVLAKINQQIAAKAEPDLIDTDRHSKRNRPGNEGNLFNYKYRYTTFTGRNSQMSALQSFLEDKEKYCWWMITGPGGMGKSRLALETIKVAIQKGWNAGFLDVKEDFDWAHWNPGYDTLMVIDYALAHTDTTATLLEKVGARAERYGNKLRILLLERSVTPEWENVKTKPAIRDYTYKHPDANILELQPPDSLWLIVADVIMQSTLCADEKYALLQRETDIMNDLRQIDPQRRPLFAFFAAKAMAYSDGKSIRGWNVDRLLEFHLTRLETEYWAKSEVYRNNALAFKKLLLIATLCRQIPADQMQQLEKELQLPADSKSMYALLTDDKANENNARGYYTGLQPDILAGYFVVSTFNSLLDGSISSITRDVADNIFSLAWTTNRNGCNQTLYLLWQDFFVLQSNSCHFDFLEYLNNLIISKKEPRDILNVSSLLIGIGNVFSEHNQHECSLEFYSKSILLYPKNAVAHNNRGSVLGILKKHNEAIDDFSRAIELDRNFAPAYYNRGIAKGYTGNIIDSIKDFTSSLNIDKLNKNCFYNRGISYANIGMHNEAIVDFTNAICLDEKFVNAYIFRSISLIHSNNKISALSDTNTAVALDPFNPECYKSRGSIQYRLGNYDDAIRDFSKAIELKHNTQEVYNNRGLAKAQKGDNVGALEDFTIAIRLNPYYAAAYFNRGVSNGYLGNIGDAISDYGETIKLQTDNSDAYKNRGIALASIEKYDSAKLDFDKAISISPNFKKVFFLRGHCHNALGNFSAACADFKKALDMGIEEAREYYEKCPGH